MGKQHAPALFKARPTRRKQEVKECTVQDVKGRLDRHESFHLVDVREDREWEAGHLPRAIHLGKGIIERDIEKTIPDTAAPIVLYCGGGFRSALAAKNLQDMGYTNVISMDGGFSGWKNAGYPLESNMTRTHEGNEPMDSSLTAAPDVLAAPSGAPSYVEDVEIVGHIIDSLILPKVLDEIMALGGRFEIREIRVGQRRNDPSYAQLRVIAGHARASRSSC